MPQVLVTDTDGSVAKIDFEEGETLMEVLRRQGYENIPALCGGCCACATCQVYVGDEWVGRLPPMREDEDEMLDSMDTRRECSRLSCQIEMVPALDGLSVTIGNLS